MARDRPSPYGELVELDIARDRPSPYREWVELDMFLSWRKANG